MMRNCAQRHLKWWYKSQEKICALYMPRLCPQNAFLSRKNVMFVANVLHRLPPHKRFLFLLCGFLL